jgi:hypothetical protein
MTGVWLDDVISNLAEALAELRVKLIQGYKRRACSNRVSKIVGGADAISTEFCGRRGIR